VILDDAWPGALKPPLATVAGIIGSLQQCSIIDTELPHSKLRGIQLSKNLCLDACLRVAPPCGAKAGGRIQVGVMRRSFTPPPNPLSPREREAIHRPSRAGGYSGIFF